ncbi:hypothetical protein BC828DRAFT_381518 [Blastocladiella britannica]|nr:hypothetical protein BC828DRAFT_381518 [Blastocladiella britannica]
MRLPLTGPSAGRTDASAAISTRQPRASSSHEGASTSLEIQTCAQACGSLRTESTTSQGTQYPFCKKQSSTISLNRDGSGSSVSRATSVHHHSRAPMDAFLRKSG